MGNVFIACEYKVTYVAIESALLRKVLRKNTIENKIVPVFVGSSIKRKGVQPIMDAVIGIINFQLESNVKDYFPSPIERPLVEAVGKNGEIVKIKADEKDPLCALAFKVIHDHHKGLLVYLRVYSGNVIFQGISEK
jgi:elongation factor G